MIADSTGSFRYQGKPIADLVWFCLGSARMSSRAHIGQFGTPGDEPFFLIAACQEIAGVVSAAGNCCSGLLRAGRGPVGLEGGRERLDFGMASCPASYGGKDLSLGMTVESVCCHVVPVASTGQVG